MHFFRFTKSFLITPRGDSLRFPKVVLSIPKAFQKETLRYPKGFFVIPKGFPRDSFRFPKGFLTIPKGLLDIFEMFRDAS